MPFTGSEVLEDEATELRGSERRFLSQDHALGFLELGPLQHLEGAGSGDVAMPRASDEHQEALLSQQGPCHSKLTIMRGLAERPTHHGAAEGVRSKPADVLFDASNKGTAELKGGVFQQVLDHIVPIWVPRHSAEVCDNGPDECGHLRGRALLHKALEDTAAKFVLCSLLCRALNDLIDNELQGLRLHSGCALLQHKVRMRAAQRIPNMPPQL
mmetsp:Transcript_135580/g.343093  ORF Transcript_135580/g.343093 Transcript_135580/m.343093 type:complete len:213 (-) Transcript_135580:200-838(-)